MPETARLCISLSPQIACRVKAFTKLTGTDFGDVLKVAFEEYRFLGKVPSWNIKIPRDTGHYRVSKVLADSLKASVGTLGGHLNHIVEASLDAFLDPETPIRSEKDNPTPDDRLGDKMTAEERQFLAWVRRTRALGLSYVRMRQILQWERIYHYKTLI